MRKVIMKVVCISKFNYYNLRIKPVMEYFSNRGDEVVYLTGNYDTMTREYYQLPDDRIKQLPVIAYRKNISFQRIYSHYQFAKQIYKQLQIEKPDVIYAMVPPNFMAYFIDKYKKKHPQTKVIFDIFDMWPETFPNDKAKMLLFAPFKIWEHLRTRSLSQANCIITECQAFNDFIVKKGCTVPVKTLYPYKQDNQLPVAYESNDILNLCYLGSINNIIDIPKIVDVCATIQKSRLVCMHIIGNGEKKEQFMQLLQQAGVTVMDYGNVYEPNRKQHIFNQCAFGINILKSSVFIGLTLKTIDYFNGGLPILNTVPTDTQQWVDTYRVGINVTTSEAVEKIAHYTQQDILDMKSNARKVYRDYLSKEQYDKTLHKLLEEVLYE